MKDIGGKGRMGLWIIAFASRPRFPLSIGIMLDHTGATGRTLFSVGIPGVTVGIGWVTRKARELDAHQAAHHAALHEQGIEHSH